MNKAKSAIISPLVIIAIGSIIAFLLNTFIGEWTFIPLAAVYWGTTFAVSYKSFGKGSIVALLDKPKKNIVWTVLCFTVGFIPLPILLLNLKLFSSPVVIILWLAFAVINPFFEEIYWRGFLLNALPFPKKASVVYSTLLFVASHPLMWGVFSIANRSWMTWLSLLFMGFVWCVTYQKTNSLRWCIISHFLVDIFNLSVFVFLNLYVPPVM